MVTRVTTNFYITTFICFYLFSFQFANVQNKLISVDENNIYRHQENEELHMIKREVNEESTLKLFHILHRHGDRTPIYYDNEELELIQWPIGFGQLTALGVNQLYKLGERIRDHLSYQFIPANYTANIVHSRASDTDRTLQSAEAFMIGFFPPGTAQYFPFQDPTYPPLPSDIQPIPIHTVDPDTDYLLRSWDNCKKYQEYLETDVYHSTAGKQLEDQYSELLALLSESFEMQVTLDNFYSVYDILHCEHTHNFYDLHNVDNDTYAQVIELENLIFSTLEFKPNENSYLLGGELIGQVITDIDNYINNKLSTKLYHYSAHDVTVGGFLSALNYQLSEVPSYSANVIIELHLISSEYYLNFTYNFEPFSIPRCDSPFGDNLCPFLTFKSVYGKYVPSDPEMACSEPYVSPYIYNSNSVSSQPVDNNQNIQNDDNKYDVFFMYFIIVVVCVITAIILGLSAYFTYLRKKNKIESVIAEYENAAAEASSVSEPKPASETVEVYDDQIID